MTDPIGTVKVKIKDTSNYLNKSATHSAIIQGTEAHIDQPFCLCITDQNDHYYLVDDNGPTFSKDKMNAWEQVGNKLQIYGDATKQLTYDAATNALSFSSTGSEWSIE